jgi:nucleotide-binding universal stress UspA family protein
MDWAPRVVVAAVDGSETSLEAAAVAASMSRQHQARLILVTVVRTPEGWWGLTGEPPTPQAVTEALASGQTRVLDQAVGQLDLEGIDYTSTLRMGEPSSTIVDLCVEEKAELLVIGRRGAGLVERMLIGSMADRLTHHAPCPLLIVP